MTYKVEATNHGRWALVAPDGRTVHVYHAEGPAQTAADVMNRANYEPGQSAYAFAEGGCGRWHRQPIKR